MTDPAPIVAFDGIAQQYKLLRVLNGVTLDVRRGDFSVIYGPPATGKSVLMRILVGLEEPTAGRILLRGFEATRIPAADRNIGYVPQSFALYPHLSVHDNIGYPLSLGGMSSRDAEPIVRHAADMLRISEHLDKRPDQLSGGQKQRVAIARGIAKQTDLFVLDDPLAGLDFKLREQLVEDLRRLQSDTQATFLYTTSDVVEAMTLADRVAIMSKGVLQQVGPPKAVYADPVNVFVAGFLGSPPMNLLRFELTEADGDPTLAAPGLVAPLAPSLARRLRRSGHAGDTVILGVRPEDVELARDDGHGGMPAEVFVVEDLGNERLVTLALGGQYAVARVAADAPAEMGERMWLRFAPGKAHLFDPTSEARIGEREAE